MQKFKGRLIYMWWFNRPWKLITDRGDIDLWPYVDKFLASLDGKRASQKQEIDGYSLAADENSEFQFSYNPGKHIILKRIGGFGLTNVHAYLDESLCGLSGRLIEVLFEEGKQIEFKPDPAEIVYEVYYFGNGNSCEVPDGREWTICKMGMPDCCVFLAMGPDGFSCEKFNGPVARILLDRLAKRRTAAKRIGNCAIAGRKDTQVPAEPKKVLPFVRRNP